MALSDHSRKLRVAGWRGPVGGRAFLLCVTLAVEAGMAKQRDARGRFVGAAGVVDEGDEEITAQRDALADRVGRCGRRAATASSDRAAALVTIYADGDDGLSKVARERSDAFTAMRRDRFFEILSETSNVRLACDMVGISQHTAYRYRRRYALWWRRAAMPMPATGRTARRPSARRARSGWRRRSG